jgi:hypothetical protein
MFARQPRDAIHSTAMFAKQPRDAIHSTCITLKVSAKAQEGLIVNNMEGERKPKYIS